MIESYRSGTTLIYFLTISYVFTERSVAPYKEIKRDALIVYVSRHQRDALLTHKWLLRLDAIADFSFCQLCGFQIVMFAVNRRSLLA